MTRKSQVNQILIASLWDLHHALFGEVLGSTPWLFFFFFLGPRVVPSLAVWCWQSSGNPNKEKAIVPVSSVKQRKAMKREQAIVHEALSSCFFFGSVSQNWSRTGPNCKEGSHKPKLKMQNSQSLLFFFFFLTKNAWSFWAKRLDEENKIGKRVERQRRSSKVSAWKMAKTAAERVRLPQQPPQKLQTAPTTTHGRSNQQASAEMTPLRPQGVPNHCQLQWLLSRYALSQRLRISFHCKSLINVSWVTRPRKVCKARLW